MRFLFAPYGTRGDVQPMLALAIRSRERGHDVEFAAPANFSDWIQSHGFPFHPFALHIEQALRTHGSETHSTRWQMRQLLTELIPDQFNVLAGCSPDADVIVSAGVQIASPFLAQARGVPHVFAIYCPAAVPNDETPPPMIARQRLPVWLNRMAWRTFERLGDLGITPAINRGLRAIGAPPVRKAMSRFWERSHGILAADPLLAPAPPGLPPEVQATDAWVLEEDEPLDQGLAEFLDTGPPPVYLGFGSMVTSDPARITQLAMRASEMAGCRLLLGSGWTALGADHRDLPDWCHVSGPAPYHVLFSRVAAVVHHGGAGTTLTAARAGVPQVVVPHLLDQHYWGHRVAALGLGPPALQIKHLTAKRLAGRMAQATNDAAIIEKARGCGAAIRPRIGTDDAVRHIEGLVSRHAM